MRARRGRPPYPATVTPAEERVLDLVRSGLTNVEIAVQLGVSVNTVRYHVANLLQKANAATRVELRSWRPEQPAHDKLRAFMPMGISLKSALGAGAVGSVVIASLGVAVLVAALRTSADDTQDTAASSVRQAVKATVTVPQLSDDRVPAVDTVVLVDWQGTPPDTPPEIQLISTATGETLATYRTGYRPMVTVRRSVNEVLLTHQVGETHVIDVLDAANGLTLKRQLATPNRPRPKIGAPTEWMALSADDRYFAYATTSMRTELRECNDGSADGPSCTRATVNIIDLEAPAASPFAFELPRHCGLGTYQPAGRDGFAVGCDDGQVFRFRPGDLEGSIDSPARQFETDPVTSRNFANATLMAVSGDGWFGNMLSNGAFSWTRDGSPEIRYTTVPAGKQLRDVVELGGGRLLTGYIDRHYDQYPLGLAIFNMSTGTIERTLPSYNIGRTMVASGPETLLAVTQDGRLIEIDLTTGRERTVRTIGTDSENFTLVR